MVARSHAAPSSAALVLELVGQAAARQPGRLVHQTWPEFPAAITPIIGSHGGKVRWQSAGRLAVVFPALLPALDCALALGQQSWADRAPRLALSLGEPADEAAWGAMAAGLRGAAAGTIRCSAAIRDALGPRWRSQLEPVPDGAAEAPWFELRAAAPPTAAWDLVIGFTSFDDLYHYGALRDLAARLGQAIQAVTGQPCQLQLDPDGVHAGRLLTAARPPLYLALVTPCFLRSPGCRAALEGVLELERATGRSDLLRPIHYLDCPTLAQPELRAADPLASLLQARLSTDWRPLRHRRPTDRRLLRAIEALARELAAAQPDAALSGLAGQVQAALDLARAEAGRGDGGAAADPAGRLPPGSVLRDVDGLWCPELVVLPPGEFLMGAPPDDPLASAEEQPQHPVKIGYRLALGRFPVTFEEYDHFAKVTGSPLPADEGWGRGRRPVIKVSWHDAKRYLAWLSAETGQAYRLPHDAEWEYACRAGTRTAYWWGNAIHTKHANFNYAFGSTSLVGSFPANPFGLFDMLGNVWEWQEDWCNDSYVGAPADGSAWLSGDDRRRTVRGGSWNNRAKVLRAAFRGRDYPDNRNNAIGFRVCRVL